MTQLVDGDRREGEDESPSVADLGPPSDGHGVESSPAVSPDALEDAPEEVNSDAVEELNRIHEAMTAQRDDPYAGFDPSYGMTSEEQQPLAAMPYDPMVRPTSQRHEEPAAPSARELKTLEDLYDAYPKLGDGSFSLRVERKQPSSYGGARIAGFLADIYQPISMSDFASRFGGGVYLVSVRGPGRSVHLEADGSQRMRTLTSIRIEIPGDPIVTAPQDRNRSTGSMDPLRNHPSVEARRLEIEAEKERRAEARMERLLSEQRRSSAFDPTLLKAIEDAANARGNMVNNANAEVINTLRNRNRELTGELDTLKKRLAEQQQNNLDIKTEMVTKLREEETRQVRELRQQHDTELRKVNETHSATITRMQADHERRIAELTERSQRDRDNIMRQESQERERLRDDANRREKSLQDDFARREQMFRDREQALKDDFARREDAIRRDYEMRYQQLERSNQRDLEMIRSSESTKTELAQRSAEMQTNLLMQENQRLSGQCDSAEQRAHEAESKYSAQVNKPLLQQVEETRTIAQSLGMLDNKDEAFDWKKQAASIASNLVDKLPEVAEGFGRVREQNRMVAEEAERVRVAQARAQAAMQQGGSAPPAMGPGPSPQQDRRVHRPPPPPGMGGPPTWDAPAGPPEPGAAPWMPAASVGPPAVAEPPPVDHHIGSPPPPEPAVPPVAGGSAPSPATLTPWESEADKPAAAPKPPAAPPQPSGAEAQPPGAAPPSPEPVVQPSAPVEQPSESPAVEPEAEPRTPAFTPEQIGEFAEQLNAAIMAGIVTPKQFAGSFIEQVGPLAASEVLQAIGPDQFVDAVAAAPGGDGTVIVTRQGRKYVHKLWAEAAKLLAQAPPA